MAVHANAAASYFNPHYIFKIFFSVSLPLLKHVWPTIEMHSSTSEKYGVLIEYSRLSEDLHQQHLLSGQPDQQDKKNHGKRCKHPRKRGKKRHQS